MCSPCSLSARANHMLMIVEHSLESALKLTLLPSSSSSPNPLSSQTYRPSSQGSGITWTTTTLPTNSRRFARSICRDVTDDYLNFPLSCCPVSSISSLNKAKPCKHCSFRPCTGQRKIATLGQTPASNLFAHRGGKNTGCQWMDDLNAWQRICGSA